MEPWTKKTVLRNCYEYAGWPQKSKTMSIKVQYQKIVLKPANGIRFIRQIRVEMKHYNIISW